MNDAIEMKSLTGSADQNRQEELHLDLSSAKAKSSRCSCSCARKCCLLLVVVGMVAMLGGLAVLWNNNRNNEESAVLVLQLPDFTLQAMNDDKTSPQQLAFDWFQNNYDKDILRSMEEWRKQQIFALATIYYSMDGPNWMPENQAKWLDSAISECDWTPATTKSVDMDWAELNPQEQADLNLEDVPIKCTPDGRVKELHLGDSENNQLYKENSKEKFVLPPEIALLPSLKDLALPTSELEEGPVSLSDMLPSEITQLTSLESLACQVNTHVVGTIPTYLGNLSSNHDLKWLFLGYNALTGPIPSELGLLGDTKLFYLDLSDNLLTGTIPSELGLITTLQHLGLGYIPSLWGEVPMELCRSNPETGLPPTIVLDCSVVTCPNQCTCSCQS